MKSVKVSEKNWETIMRLKLDYGYKSFDEILESLLRIVPATQLKKKEAKKNEMA